MNVLGISKRDTLVGLSATLVIATPLFLFFGKDKLNEQPFINEGRTHKVHITRGVLQDGIIQRPQVKILPLDSCRVIEYNDFVEVSVVDSKSGKILFATKDREEYAKYREKKMLKLPMHAWFSFGEFGESKSEIKEPLYHPADSIDRQAPATTTQLIPATYTGSASPLYRHDYIYLGPVSKTGTFMEIDRTKYSSPSQVRIWYWKYLSRQGKVDKAAEGITKWLERSRMQKQE